MSDVFSALADPTRRKILKLLKKKDLTAGEIAQNFDMAKPSVSHHLNILKNANLITYKKKGQNIIYSINTSVLEDIFAFIADLKDK
ncbi:MAG: helix-turn-helix transcriptional regulator [Clostridiaceae bacterium]|nr:helix-turn-helix transcriptional regulator [Clostridiaceae bacterium]